MSFRSGRDIWWDYLKIKQNKQKRTKSETITLPDTERASLLSYILRGKGKMIPGTKEFRASLGNRVRPHLQHHSIQLNMYFWSVCFKNSVFNYEKQWMNTATFNFRGHKGPLSLVCSASGFPTAHRNTQLKKNRLRVGGGRPSLPVLVFCRWQVSSAHHHHPPCSCNWGLKPVSLLEGGTIQRQPARHTSSHPLLRWHLCVYSGF